MKTLLVLRHAKSSWKDPALDDHDRPLNGRGKRAASRMGALLADEDLVPDRILCSTARRALQTARRVVEACGFEGGIEERADFYGAPPATYLQALARLPADCERVMVVGHNPGMEDLVARLAGEALRFPTAALAAFAVDTERWTEVGAAPARLVQLWRPRELSS